MPFYLHTNPRKFQDLKSVSSFLKKKLGTETKDRKAGDASHDSSIVGVKDELARLASKMKLWSENKSKPTTAVLCMELAMNGDMVLREHSGVDGEVKASDLNAAAADTHKSYLTVYLETASGARHVWATHEPDVSVTESVADANVTVPGFTIEDRDLAPAAPKWDKGKLKIAVTWDTDADATKHYIAGDSIDVVVEVASDDKLLGWTVAQITRTYNVV